MRSSTWSRTRFRTLLKLVEFYWFQVIAVESFAAFVLKSVEFY
jgi:hypothetical protein